MPTTAAVRSFWDEQLNHLPTPTVSSTPVEGLTDTVSIDDVTFTGAHGDPIRAWFTRPTNSPTRGVVVEYLGYGRGRGKPFERLWWAAAGFAHLLMDTRGQGSQYGTGGETPDPHGSGPHVPGFLTKGINSPHDLYYVRLILDGVAAVSAAEKLSGHQRDRVFLSGNSQGGGIALAVAGLLPGLGGVTANVPLLCDIERSVETASDGPYLEARTYAATHRERVDALFDCLAHVDVVNIVPRSTTPALVSYGLADTLCPVGGVRRMLDAYGSDSSHRVPVEVVEYRFNGHDGGDATQLDRQLRWVRDRAVL
ncbi:acetylxylan esterase [Jonesia quinghaiensis]|uniref:acetylxylan esterase n=1 Tax=Jonesia quinghaiensis TaxID=262806 RepID=UPI00041CB553|nr:acetylxylan esterase [Jonesia quinghaiensis]